MHQPLASPETLQSRQLRRCVTSVSVCSGNSARHLTFSHHRASSSKHFININKYSPAVDVYFIIDISEQHWWSLKASLPCSVSEYSLTSAPVWSVTVSQDVSERLIGCEVCTQRIKRPGIIPHTIQARSLKAHFGEMFRELSASRSISPFHVSFHNSFLNVKYF